jgi:anthranilate synthase component I
MKPPFDITADLDTPVSAFRKLKAFDPVFLLESVEGGSRLARYSFIGLGRAVEVVVPRRGGGVGVAAEGASVRGGGVRRVVEGDLAAVMAGMRRALEDAPRLMPEVPGLPLDGGLVGAIGYDFVRRIEEKSLGHAEGDTALESRATGIRATGSRGTGADQPDVVLVAPRSMLVFDHLSRRVALLHSGAEWERQSLRREIIAALRGAMPETGTKRGHEPATGSLSEAEFVERVGRVKEHIKAGDVFQLVLSVRFEGACHSDPFEVYRALRLLNPSPYMYFFDFGDRQVVGSSPEALVKLQNGQMDKGPNGQVEARAVATLRPIAGTRPRGADEASDVAMERELLADPKEAAEHVMLVDLARNDLGRVAVPGTVKVEPYRAIERYSHVMHIVSGVQGEVEGNKDAFDLFAATFPAGTVTGAPKVRAMEIIDELEPVRRGFYAGTVGYFAKSGSMDQAIAIRTVMFADGRYAYQAGAGIVEASDPAAEYREVRAKVGAIEAALKLAEEGL